MPVLRLRSLAVALGLRAPSLQAQPLAAPVDIDRLIGPGWTGTRTYRDYSIEARKTIEAALRLARIVEPTDAGARWDFRVAYADEPHANSGDTISLSFDGRRFRDATIAERRARVGERRRSIGR